MSETNEHPGKTTQGGAYDDAVENISPVNRDNPKPQTTDRGLGFRLAYIISSSLKKIEADDGDEQGGELVA